jgi:hypothetical protein
MATERTHELMIDLDTYNNRLGFRYTEGALVAQATHPDSEYGDRNVSVNREQVRALLCYFAMVDVLMTQAEKAARVAGDPGHVDNS